MVALRDDSPRFTPEEYFVWEEQQKFKHEYFDGQVYAMTGGSLNHSRIGANFTRLLGNHLSGSGCLVLNSDARVNIQESDNYVYPDASVTCDDRDKNKTQFISHPCLVVEVLSPSTELYDRTKKFKLYQRSSSLQEYVMVGSTEMSIDLYRKDEQGEWKILSYVAGDLVELKSINLTFPIEQVFEGIVFEDEVKSLKLSD